MGAVGCYRSRNEVSDIQTAASLLFYENVGLLVAYFCRTLRLTIDILLDLVYSQMY